MSRVQIHCYGCNDRTSVPDTGMAETLRHVGWTVSHGETYCPACTAKRAPAVPPMSPAEPAAEQPAPIVAASWDEQPPPPARWDVTPDDVPAPAGPLAGFALGGNSAVASGEGRISRALRLIQASAEILRRDPRLLIFPIVAIVANVVILGVAFGLAAAQAHGLPKTQMQHAYLTWGAIALVPRAYISLFCGVALACMLSSHLDGVPMDVPAAFRAAGQRAGVIAAWTVVFCTISLALALIERGMPRIVRSLINNSFYLLTAFTVPILAYERSGPIGTMNRSRQLLRQGWREQILGAAGFGIGGSLLTLPFAAMIVVGLVMGGFLGALLVALGGAGLFALLTALDAAEQVYRVSLYRYAVGTDTTGAGAFTQSDLQRPFVGRRRR